MVCQAPTAPFASARNRLRDIVIGALLNSGLAHLLFLPRPPALIMPARPMMRTALRTGERRSLCFNLHADIDVASLHTFPFIAGDGNKQRRNPQH